jgi:hypothetical protein
MSVYDLRVGSQFHPYLIDSPTRDGYRAHPLCKRFGVCSVCQNLGYRVDPNR